jgi:hypothetical protein
MKRTLGYLWASPNTALGLCFLPLSYVSGGKARLVQGVIEIEGGFARWFLRNGLIRMQASALTLGHVVLGQDRLCLDYTREHEHVHVRQYQRWGPFFLPAYFLSSFLAWRRGENPYLDNRFEKEAYAISG